MEKNRKSFYIVFANFVSGGISYMEEMKGKVKAKGNIEKVIGGLYLRC